MTDTIQKPQTKLERALPYVLIVLGIIGFLCAFIIMFEKLKLLQDPDYKPSCSLNPVISCGNVMSSPQSHAFGFPNPFIGLAAYPMLIAFGAFLLGGATKLKRWVWLSLQAGTIFGLAFVHWLFFESVYRIQALCPYCMVVWTITIAIFWYVLLYNLRVGHITLPGKLKRITPFLHKHHADILAVWYLIIIGLIVHHFWYYFQTLL